MVDYAPPTRDTKPANHRVIEGDVVICISNSGETAELKATAIAIRNNGCKIISVIIECKKETVDARNAKDGIAQLQSYMSVCPNCEWGMWTNSIQKYVFRKVIDEAGNITFMEYNDIPSADGNLDDVNRPSTRSYLTNTRNTINPAIVKFRVCSAKPSTIYTTICVQAAENCCSNKK